MRSSQSSRSLLHRVAKVLPCHQECMCACLIMSMQLPWAGTLHRKSLRWNVSSLCRPWPCPFQTASHLWQIARQRERRGKQSWLFQKLFELQDRQALFSKFDLNLTWQHPFSTQITYFERVNTELKGHGILANLGVNSSIGFASVWQFNLISSLLTKNSWGSRYLINPIISKNQCQGWWYIAHNQIALCGR